WRSTRMKNALLSFMVLVLLIVCSTLYANVHWGYEGENAPAHWADLSTDYQLCQNGINQSPINIDHTFPTQIATLKIHYVLTQADIVNNGHTIQVSNQQTDDYIRSEERRVGKECRIMRR